MRKTFKYRLFPTKAQRKQMQRILDRCRWVYNKTVEARRDAWQERQESLSRYTTNRMLTAWREASDWLADGHAQAQQDAQKRVDLAFRAFFRRVKAGAKPGYPRFKGEGWYDSFTYPQQKSNWRWLEDGRLRLSKIGDVKIKLHRPLHGVQKTLTLCRDRLGNWYACFACEIEADPLPLSSEMVGVDLGLKTFATFSTGETINRKRWMRQDAQDIARLQRKKERYAKGSSERRKVLRALNHAYRRAANRRSDFAHQESRKLVNRFGLLAFEDLDISDMQSRGNHLVNRGIADVAWRRFVQFTTYKAESAGREVLLVNPTGTTRDCSGCGLAVPKDLRARVHECPRCGLVLDRDLNAALNILARGLASLDSGPRSSPLGRAVTTHC